MRNQIGWEHPHIDIDDTGFARARKEIGNRVFLTLMIALGVAFVVCVVAQWLASK